MTVTAHETYVVGACVRCLASLLDAVPTSAWDGLDPVGGSAVAGRGQSC